MKKMAYRPGNIRKVEIPKEGKPGAFRPLGISNFEDKIIQSMTSKILVSIYDPIFRKSSFGFRPQKSCHDAVKALYQHLNNREVAVVIDIDLENFFGTIDHKILENLMRDKIKDPKFMRYIVRMFKAGILSKGELKVSEEGVPQGSVCSPTMANIYAHHALDTWIEDTINPQSQGEIQLFRYADDSVICCEREEDAKALLEALEARLAEFKLKLNVEKTEIVSFSKRKARQGIRQGVFDFLGFTFYLGKSRRGNIVPKIKTSKKRFKAKLQRVKEWMKLNRNRTTMQPLWRQFCIKIRGHIQYYGVSFNSRYVGNFLYETKRTFFKWINRRSQRKSMTWEQFAQFEKQFPMPRNVVKVSLF